MDASGVEADRLERIQGKGLGVDTKKPPMIDRRVAAGFVETDCLIYRPWDFHQYRQDEY